MNAKEGPGLRVTFVLAHANLSGGVRVVATYADKLRTRGHDVTIISTPKHPVGVKAGLRSLARGAGWPSNGLGAPSHIDGSKLDHRVIPVWRPVTDDDVPDADVVVATWWETAPWVRDLSASKGAKCYFMQDYGLAPGQPLDRIIETWKHGLRMVTISQFLRDLVRRHAPQSVEVIPNAVDTDLFRAAPRSRQERPTIGFLYSLNPLKGTDTCIRAVEHARKRLPALRVVAFGPEAPARDMPLPADCVYRSRVPDRDLPAIYAGCDAWLFGTRREGFGLPILEAMACGTPVIATPAGAAPELITRGGGVLVPLDDPEAMGDSIVGLMTMRGEDWRSMSDRASHTARSWTWDDATDRLEAVLRDACGRPVASLGPEATPLRASA